MLVGRAALFFLLSVSIIPIAHAAGKERYLSPGPIHLDKAGEKWAEKTLKNMTLEQKVGQLFMVRIGVTFTNFDSPEYKRLRESLRSHHVGGITVTVPVDGPFLLRNQPYETAMLINQLQRDSDIPLIMSADFERGLSMRMFGASVFPHAMAFGASSRLDLTEEFGKITAEEARAIGIHWNFFPVADVNSNPANPIINTRSFGEDPAMVSDFVDAYIKGAHEGGMLTTVKHFPGHGDTASDSHLALASVNVDKEHLDQVELVPFKKAIAAGVDSVMVAHVTVPALDSDANSVATVSHRVVTGLLKDKLGFKGIVITDGMEMNGLMRLYASNPNPSGAACVAALKAGNDVLLIPPDLDTGYRGVLQAVRNGEIPLKQIDDSVLKILRAKASLGLNKARLVDVDEIGHRVGRTENVAVGQKIADEGVTLVRDNGQVLPLKSTFVGTHGYVNPYTLVEHVSNRTVAVLFVDDIRTEAGRTFERNLRWRIPDAKVMYVDPLLAGPLSPSVLDAVQQAEKVLAVVYAVPVPGKVARTASGDLENTVSVADTSGSLLHRILQIAAAKTMVIAMGNPYFATDYPEIQNYMCTFSNTSVSEVSAVKAMFGNIAIDGHLPVSIPEIAARGVGLSRPEIKGGTPHAISSNYVQ
ncbi:MAG TPA: glycoside hydrolase family 3 protein [Terriglobales bacterium]|nr:glycoside hydrolase family 3 protein [Terriglobales bacterium]